MISILIKSAKKFGLEENRIRLWAQKALKKYQLNNCELSLIFVEPKEILNLNRHYRHLDEATSILTFFQGQANPEKIYLLGDIVICPLVAAEKNLTIEFLINHGIRNLLSEISTTKSLRT